MEKGDIIDVEKIVEQSKSILKGETLPKSSEGIQKTLETIGSEVEQVRYAEGEKLSETGQAVLKDLEEILVGGAEVTAAIPPETFLHAARAQKKVSEAAKPEIASEKASEGEQVAMNLASLLRMSFTSNEFRDVLSDWSKWLKDVLIVQIEEAQKSETSEPAEIVSEIGQVPVEEPESLKNRIPEVKDEQLDKLIGMLEWMQERAEYQQAVGYIFNQLSNLPIILGIEPAEGTSEESIVDQKKLKEAVDEAKKVGQDTLKAVENWTNRSTSQFQSHLNSFSIHLKSDEKLRSSLQSFAHFLANCFNEPGFLNDRKWIRDEARDQLDAVRSAIEQEGYKKDLQGLADETRDLIKSLDREPRTAHLKESLRKLLEDLFMTESGGQSGIGSFRLKTELINDMGVIVGGLLQRAKYLSVPDIEVHDEDLDFTAHNIILDAAELIPQQFKMTFVTENMVEKARQKEMLASEGASELSEEQKEKLFVEREPLHPQVVSGSISTVSPATSEWQSHLKFEIKGVHGHCRNVHFNFRKRSGFPQLTDEGLADLRVWGPKGMVVKVVLRPEWIKQETVEREIHTKETIETTSSKPIAVTPSESSSNVSRTSSTQKFKLEIVKAHCEIDELDLDLHGTGRDWFYTVMGPLVRKRVKSALESTIERNLLTLMD